MKKHSREPPEFLYSRCLLAAFPLISFSIRWIFLLLPVPVVYTFLLGSSLPALVPDFPRHHGGPPLGLLVILRVLCIIHSAVLSGISCVCVCVCVSQSVSSIHDSQIMFNTKQYAREAREAWEAREIWEAGETWQQGISVVVRCRLQYEPSTTPVITSPVLFLDYCSTVPILQHQSSTIQHHSSATPMPSSTNACFIFYMCMHLVYMYISAIVYAQYLFLEPSLGKKSWKECPKNNTQKVTNFLLKSVKR